MTSTTLEALADAGHVYLDGSILSMDRDSKEYKDRPYLNNHNDFADLIGAAYRFADVPYARIKRQALFASRLATVVVPRPEISSVPRVVSDYRVYVRHLERQLDFFRMHSAGKRAAKEETFVQLVDAHTHICGILEARSREDSETRTLGEFLYDNRFHIPRDDLFVKASPLSDYPGAASPTLVSRALLDATVNDVPVSVVSANYDIVNLVRNMAFILRRGVVIAGVDCRPRQPVRVYFPASTNWTKELGVEFYADSAGDCRRLK